MGGSRIGGTALVLLATLAIVGSSATTATARKGASRRAGCSHLLSLGFGQSPAALEGSIEPGVLNGFAVLRRAIGPADQLPQLNPLERELSFQLAGYYPRYTRQLLAFPDGRRFFIIVGLPRVFPIPPAHCLPRKLRARRNQLVEDQRKRAAEPVFCVTEVGLRRPIFSEGGGGCVPFASIATGDDIVQSDSSTSAVIDIVPDGVGTVRLRYRDGTVISAGVSENVYTYTPPQAPIRRAESLFTSSKPARELERGHLSGRERREYEKSLYKLVERAFSALAPSQVEWLAPNGQVLRAIVPRAGGGGLLDAVIGFAVGG